MDQVIQIAAALLILAAFVAAQAGLLSTRSMPYLVLNLLGSAVLAVLAWVEAQWGFLLLEAAWALVSAWALLRRGPGRADPAAG